jgi:hypothetical protein
MMRSTVPATRILSVAAIIFATTCITGATIHAVAAPVPFAAVAPLDPPELDAGTLVRTALDKIGGKSWDAIQSYESVATVQSAMGDGRIEFQFIAPDARRLVQTMPGGGSKMELGSVGSSAWMGEPRRARAVDPKMAEELAGGGDLLTLVRSIDTRFTDFKLLGKDTVEGVSCFRISMRPTQSPAPEVRWTLYMNAADATIVGIDVPPPPSDLAPNAPVQGGQSIRFRRWEPVERPAPASPQPKAAPAAAEPKLLAFREATVTTAGMRVDLVYSKVAVDTLAKGAIAPPAGIEPAPGQSSTSRP